MNLKLQHIEESAAYLEARGYAGATIGVVLGTGLGSFIHKMEMLATIPYHEIPNFPVATVEFHKGQLVHGKIGSTRIIAMQGRFHYYEGYSQQAITFPIRVLKRLGIKCLFISNAAGGMNPDYKKADLVLLDDHINFQGDNPLRGLNEPAFGNRFPDMSRPYDLSLNQLLKATAEKEGIVLKEGIYVAVNGSNLETRAEYRFLRMIGADMVGMSTVPEVIVANQLGLPCAAISVITDECDPDNLQPVNITEIIEVAGRADAMLSTLIAAVIGGGELSATSQNQQPS